jgi:hypothetical protein
MQSLGVEAERNRRAGQGEEGKGRQDCQTVRPRQLCGREAVGCGVTAAAGAPRYCYQDRYPGTSPPLSPLRTEDETTHLLPSRGIGLDSMWLAGWLAGCTSFTNRAVMPKSSQTDNSQGKEALRPRTRPAALDPSSLFTATPRFTTQHTRETTAPGQRAHGSWQAHRYLLPSAPVGVSESASLSMYVPRYLCTVLI